MEDRNPPSPEGSNLHYMFLQQMPLGILVAESPSGRVVFCNRMSTQMLRHDFDLAQDIDSYAEFGATHPDGRPYLPSEYPLSRALRGETVSQEELLYRRGDGTMTCLLINAAPLYDAQGNIIRAILSFDDISGRKQTELQLADIRAKLQLATEIAGLGFFEWEPRTGRVYLSEEWKRQLGYEDHELPDEFWAWESRLHPSDRNQAVETVRRFVTHPWPDYQAEFRLRHRDGRWRWICCRAQAIYDQNGQIHKMVGTHLDITERREAEEQLRRAVQYDSLTGLPNRALLYELAGHMLTTAERTGQQVAVLFVDIDRFKPINDTYGHQIGDEVLKLVADRLRKAARPGDVVARLGGDDFLIVTFNIRAASDAVGYTEQLIEQMIEPFVVGELELQVSPSIGISLYPDDGQDIGALIRHADTAMCHAKVSGRGSFQFFTRALERRAVRTLDMERRLRASLSNGDLELAYQPILNSKTGEPAAVEALLRWPQPDGGYIQPQVFIPVAERSGLIAAMGEWVLEQACVQHRLWLSEGLPPVRIAVNLSPVQFRGGNLERTIGRILSVHGVEPEALDLEVTESMIMDDVEEASEILRRLRRMGMRVALDDFGTGYSSLSQLGRLPLDKLKVDQAFVRNLFRDNMSVAITEAIISLGRNLGLNVVAEGIETERALNFFHETSCDEVQGFYLSHPMSARQFSEWSRQRKVKFA